MSNIREIVDVFLLKHQDFIESSRQSKDFKWSEILDLFKKETKQTSDSEYLRSRFRKLKAKNITSVTTTNPAQKFIYLSGKEDKLKGTSEFHFTADNIPSEKEVIEHFKIDTTKYRISQIWHKTTPSGKYSISVNLQAITGIEASNYEEKFENFVSKYNKTILENPSKNSQKLVKDTSVESSLYLISLADIHLGNYQREGYIESLKARVFYALSLANDSGADEVLVLNTGDMLHTDTSKSQTWNNTQLDSQDSFEDAFTNGLDLITDIIDYGRGLSLKITFINVRGNHSFDSEFCLGEGIRRIYKKDSQVKVLNKTDTRIYYKWNNNGFCFTHGDKGVERLPLLFATEGKEVFSNTEHHHILLGHLHHNRGKQYLDDRGEFAGIEVRVLGSPTSNDIWHKQSGFCQNKKAIQCMVFTPNQGKYAEFNFKM